MKPVSLPALHAPRPRRARHRKSSQAFTLPELLIYTAASGLLLVLATTTLLSSLRSNRAMEIRQRAEERWNRISALIQSEAGEAQEVLTTGQLISCTNATGDPIAAVLSLRIPYLTANQGERKTIDVHYYLTGSGASVQLLRCGPPFSANGALNIGTISSATVSLRTDLQVSIPNSDSFTYTLNFYTPEGTLALSRSGTATVGVEPTNVCNAAQTTCNP